MKTILIIGHESTGSMLIGRIVAKAMNVNWNGAGILNYNDYNFHHVSLPAGIPPQFENIEEYIALYKMQGDCYIVITTRDITLSEKSRMKRFNKSLNQVENETKIATSILSKILTKEDCFLFSYETLIIYKQLYFERLLQYLDIESELTLDENILYDANRNKINELTKKRRIFKKIL